MEASTILPMYGNCTCGKKLVHDDFILYMLEAGVHKIQIYECLEFISIQLDCCIDSYDKLSVDVQDDCQTTFNNLKDEMRDLKKAMAVYYLYNRGVGLNVISHLLRLPKILSLKSRKIDCRTCGCIVPNKNEVKQLLNDRKELAKYIHMYDIPRSCCIKNILSGDMKTEELEYEVLSAVKGVPVEEMDFMLCRECGTALSGIHDYSLLEGGHINSMSSRSGKFDQHISGDCLRQAERWGLPMEIGYHCHSVDNICCRMSIRGPSIHYLASNKYNERRSQQHFISSVHLCK